MNRNATTIATMLFSASLGASCGESQGGSDAMPFIGDGYQLVSLVRVIADPAAFYGEKVEVRGDFIAGSLYIDEGHRQRGDMPSAVIVVDEDGELVQFGCKNGGDIGAAVVRGTVHPRHPEEAFSAEILADSVTLIRRACGWPAANFSAMRTDSTEVEPENGTSGAANEFTEAREP